jgi:hypothetical protein
MKNFQSPRETVPAVLINHIDHEHQKLKMLINSFRERSPRHDDSLFNDSDRSRNEVLSDNRSYKL